MPIYPRGDSFMVSVGSGEGRYRENFPTLAQAQEAELKEKLRRKQGGLPKVSQAPKGRTLKEAFTLTCRLRWTGTKGEATAVMNASAWLDALGEETELSAINSDLFMEGVTEFEDRGNSGGTINRKISALSTMLQVASEQRPPWLSEVPKFPRMREGAHRIRWFDEAEEKAILAKAVELGLFDLHDYIIVAIDTGFRRSELLPFPPKDFSNGVLHLHAGATKNDDARSVPATKRVEAIISARQDQERLFEKLTKSSLRWQWDQVKFALGMENDSQFVVHTLRHTCASRLVQRGVHLAVVQKWMGHKHIQTTMRYAHLAADSLQGARDALEGIMAKAAKHEDF